jgi:hypothetical protein
MPLAGKHDLPVSLGRLLGFVSFSRLISGVRSMPGSRDGSYISGTRQSRGACAWGGVNEAHIIVWIDELKRTPRHWS